MPDSSNPPSMLQRSSILRFFRWLFTWRILRRLLIILAWVATAIALVYAEENWRGRRAWNQYKDQLIGRGEQLDFYAFVPKPVPDDQNFGALPITKSWFDRSKGFQLARWKDDFSRVDEKFTKKRADNANRRFIDLAEWNAGFAALAANQTELPPQFVRNQLDLNTRIKAAPGVLQGLKSSEPILEELRAGSSRPYSRYAVNYTEENPWSILLPHLANIRFACQRLQVKACAELVLGQKEQALEDVKLLLYLVDSLRDEPILISCLVRAACYQLSLQPVWEGLVEHHWSEPQLKELQGRFETNNFLAAIKMPLDAERAASVLTIDLIRRKGHLTEFLDVIFEEELICRIAPRGWYYREQRNYCQLLANYVATACDLNGERVFPGRSQAEAARVEKLFQQGPFKLLSQHLIATRILLPDLNSLLRKAAGAQTASDEATLACALERYRLAKGEYPAQLETLIPQFLGRMPLDPITGKPYIYKPVENGKFIIYSIGWNEKDDGGTSGKELFDQKNGDWVWDGR